MSLMTLVCSQHTADKHVTDDDIRVSVPLHTPSPVERTYRVLNVQSRFGLPAQPESSAMARNTTSAANPATAEVSIPHAPGGITLIMGPSGAGKTSLLREIARAHPQSRNVNEVTFTPTQAVVDQVLTPGELTDALRILTQCGLGEPRLWLRRYDELSVGEQFRARLARTVGLAHRDAAPPLLLCDEFAAALADRQARALAHSLRRLVARTGLCLIAASTRGDLVVDLQPDCVVLFRERGRAMTVRRKPQRRALSLLAGMEIVEGSRRDYDRFAEMHYRRRDELGFVDRVFVLRRRASALDDEPLGIVVYTYPPLELALRNAVTAGRYSGNAARLNRDLRTLRRLVIHPDLRGCGVGRLLVCRTLGRLGVSLVECLANMGDVNPVFERAGMRRVGRCALPEAQRRIARALAERHADPHATDFAAHVARRPEVRRLVAEGVYRWYCTITSAQAARSRVVRQSPAALAETYRQVAASRPIYYLWERPR